MKRHCVTDRDGGVVVHDKNRNWFRSKIASVISLVCRKCRQSCAAASQSINLHLNEDEQAERKENKRVTTIRSQLCWLWRMTSDTSSDIIVRFRGWGCIAFSCLLFYPASARMAPVNVMWFYQFCPSVCPSRCGIVFKRMHISSSFSNLPVGASSIF